MAADDKKDELRFESIISRTARAINKSRKLLEQTRELLKQSESLSYYGTKKFGDRIDENIGRPGKASDQ